MQIFLKLRSASPMEAKNIFLSKALSHEKEKKATKKGAHESYKTPI